MLKDLLIKNRSYRGYDRSVRMNHSDLEELVELTRYTPSSVNKQPLKYHIASTEEEVMAIMPYTLWAKGLKELHLPFPGTEPTAFIVISQDLSIDSHDSYQRDVGIVAQVMLLGAVEKGFGGCMIGSFNKAGIKELLGFDETINPKLVIAFGKPAEQIVLIDTDESGSTAYFRKDGIHYVPKRKLEDILN